MKNKLKRQLSLSLPKISLVYFSIILLILLSVLSSNTENKSKTNLKSSSSYCGPLCLECIDRDPNQCIVCRTGIFKYRNRCFNKCPDGTYTDEEWLQCRDCDFDCPICLGALSDQCGNIIGTRTQVVLLEEEIKHYRNTRRSIDYLWQIRKCWSREDIQNKKTKRLDFESSWFSKGLLRIERHVRVRWIWYKKRWSHSDYSC
jgi:hypothetical protein